MRQPSGKCFFNSARLPVIRVPLAMEACHHDNAGFFENEENAVRKPPNARTAAASFRSPQAGAAQRNCLDGIKLCEPAARAVMFPTKACYHAFSSPFGALKARTHRVNWSNSVPILNRCAWSFSSPCSLRPYSHNNRYAAKSAPSPRQRAAKFPWRVPCPPLL